MKAYGGVNVQTNVFLTSVLVATERLTSRSGRFAPGEGAHGTHWNVRWVGPKISLDVMKK
jgi:hypothetical protein